MYTNIDVYKLWIAQAPGQINILFSLNIQLFRKTFQDYVAPVWLILLTPLPY